MKKVILCLCVLGLMVFSVGNVSKDDSKYRCEDNNKFSVAVVEDNDSNTDETNQLSHNNGDI